MIDLPTTPSPTNIRWEVLDFGGTMQGPVGGSAQRINRLGNRWSLMVTLPPMLPADADQWEAALLRGLRQGVRWRIIQAFNPEGAGSPLVDGGSQAGDQLDVKGFNAGYWCRRNQPFAIVSGGKRYVHRVVTAQQIGADGTATLEIEPPLRVEPTDEDVLEFSAPYIEGLLAEPVTGDFSADRIVHGLSFTINEAG